MGIKNMTVYQVVTENLSCDFWYSYGGCLVMLQTSLQDQQLLLAPPIPKSLARESTCSRRLR